MRTALYGEDAESVRAAALLIKVCRMGVSCRFWAGCARPGKAHVSTISQPYRNSGDVMDVTDESATASMRLTQERFCLLISGSLVRVQHPEPFLTPCKLRALRGVCNF